MEIRRQREIRSKGSRKKGLTAQQKREGLWQGLQAQINRLTHVELTKANTDAEKLDINDKIRALRAKQDRIRQQG